MSQAPQTPQPAAQPPKPAAAAPAPVPTTPQRKSAELILKENCPLELAVLLLEIATKAGVK